MHSPRRERSPYGARLLRWLAIAALACGVVPAGADTLGCRYLGITLGEPVPDTMPAAATPGAPDTADGYPPERIELTTDARHRVTVITATRRLDRMAYAYHVADTWVAALQQRFGRAPELREPDRHAWHFGSHRADSSHGDVAVEVRPAAGSYIVAAIYRGCPQAPARR